MSYERKYAPIKHGHSEFLLDAPSNGSTYARLNGEWVSIAVGATTLLDLADVNTATPTNRNVLVADGVDWESRALVEADISDLQAYLTDAPSDGTTYGRNNGAWTAIAGGGGLTEIVEDITPQLGGTLDANGWQIDMGVNSITDTKVGQWDTAFGWGDHAGLYADASHTHLWADITDKPSTFTPSSHTHTESDITNLGDYAVLGSLSQTNTYLYVNRNSSTSPGFYVLQAGSGPIARFGTGALGATPNSNLFTINNDGGFTSAGIGQVSSLNISNTSCTLTQKASGVLGVENRAVVTLASTSYTSSEITFSTGAPSGGADGDIWFEY